MLNKKVNKVLDRLNINSAWGLGFRRKSQKLKAPFRDFHGGP